MLTESDFRNLAAAAACREPERRIAPTASSASGPRCWSRTARSSRAATSRTPRTASPSVAERNAVFRAAAHGHRTIVAVAVYTPTTSPTAPCGACRQVINEFGPDAEIFSVCDGPGTIRARLSELLPQAFGPQSLGQ